MVFSVSANGFVSGFINKTVVVEQEQFVYQLYVPENYEKGSLWSLTVFLHGAGERGSNALLTTEVGLGSAIRKNPDQFPTIALFPQCPAGEWWSSAVCEKIVLKSIADTLQSYSIDQQRLYLTGLSMGGYGVWHFASKYPDRWSALFAICGRVKPGGGHKPAPNSIAADYSGEALYTMTAEKIRNIPVWIVHGEKDQIVPVGESQKMYAALKGLSADVNYVEYENMPHNVWDKAFADKEIIDWLYAQRRKEGE